MPYSQNITKLRNELVNFKILYLLIEYMQYMTYYDILHPLEKFVQLTWQI